MDFRAQDLLVPLTHQLAIILSFHQSQSFGIVEPIMETFTLPSGRKIDYLISGDPQGFPLLYLHGTPGAYPSLTSLSRACKTNKLKLISFSRSGYGGSTRHKGRKNVDIVDDAKALLEHLGHEKCVAAGWSGGGTFSHVQRLIR